MSANNQKKSKPKLKKPPGKQRKENYGFTSKASIKNTRELVQSYKIKLL